MATLYTPHKRTIGELLTITNPAIIVPEWQRNYSWTRTEVEIFWKDLLAFDQAYPGENINEQEYFLGSAVIVDVNTANLLLDGQQRIATSAILISVIRDFLLKYSRDSALRISSRYLTDFDDSKNSNTYKLTLNRYDRDFFKREISEMRDTDYVELAPQMESHRLIRGTRLYFGEKFEQKYTEINDPPQAHQWALRILKVLTHHFSIVTVVSSDEDNAANVFETLNDRGIGLSTPDLLRNLLLRRANPNQQEEIINLWGDILEIDGDAKLKTFLRHFWLSREGDVKTQSLYKEIKEKITNQNLDSLTFSRSIRESSLIYKDIVASHDNDPENRRLLLDINELDADLFFPLVMSAYEVGDTKDIQKLLKAIIVSYVRHNTIGRLENSKLEKVIYEQAKALRSTKNFLNVIEELKKVAPNDTQFQNSFATAIVNRRSAARYILKELEYALRKTEEITVSPPNRVHVEHIYPQTPPQNLRWSNHSSIVDRIGNLTLLSSKLNMSIQNADFAVKRITYQYSELLLTRKLTDYSTWDISILNQRQLEFSNLAPQIWKFPM